jgi:hypothetical protein
MKVETVTAISGSPESEPSPKLEAAMQDDRVFLIPKPSDDPRDPLVCLTFKSITTPPICVSQMVHVLTR